MKQTDGILEIKIGRSKKRFPFSIMRIVPNRLSLVLHNFRRDDKWAVKSLLNHLFPDQVFVAVYSRYIQSQNTTRYYFSLYTYEENLSSFIKDNSITIPCTLYLGGWEKSYNLGVKFTIRFNENGILRLFNKLV